MSEILSVGLTGEATVQVTAEVTARHLGSGHLCEVGGSGAAALVAAVCLRARCWQQATN